VAAAVLTVTAFATVLPACLFHAELLEALGAWRQLSCRPRRIPAWMPPALASFGAFCLASALLFPRFAFPLIWFAPVGLEALNYRSGAPSLLRDFQEGNRRRLARLLLGGLWAGGVWELFNSWARCKWIYAVPGFGRFKIFEMPLAGFLGFPVLTIGAFCFFSAVSRIGHWPVWRRRVVLTAAVLFCVAIYPELQRQTVRSLRPLLSELPSLDAPARARLAAVGVETPERLARAACREGIQSLSERTAISADRLRRVRDESVLALHKGMGAPGALLLEASGVGDIGRLAREDPDALWRRLVELASRLEQELPRLPEVRVWVSAAQRLPADLPRR